MGKLILILGGARGGKSTYAEKIALEQGGPDVLYVATAEAKDENMGQRIEKHQASRPQEWHTLESPMNVAQAIKSNMQGEKIVLVDCLTVLVSNILLANAGPEDDPFSDPSSDPFDARIEAQALEEAEALIACVDEMDGAMIIVSNEVGMGVVPPYELGRAYRDALGRVNQAMAQHACEVYLLVAGLPMRLK